MTLRTEAETKEFAKSLIRRIEGTDWNSTCVVILLSGELGAGKTVIVRGLARGLGVEQAVNSPSYLYVKEYLLKSETGPQKLVHIDLWRVEQSADFDALKITDFIAPGNLVAIEWPKHLINKELLAELIAPDEQIKQIEIEIEVNGVEREVRLAEETIASQASK